MKLDPEQLAIVKSEAPNIVVVAGAGSGKTRVLTERIKDLIHVRNVNPASIVAITFTNMAAEEMKERLTDVQGIGDAFIGTIHSFANRIMRNSGESYEIFNEDIENKFVGRLIRRYCKSLSMDAYLRYRELAQKADLGLIDESAPGESLSPPERHELSMLTRSAEQTRADNKEIRADGHDPKYPESVGTMCEANGVITFDELLRKATAYFDSLGVSLDHVLVDELQDIGTLEYLFIKTLRAKNYFFVGDDWQAIYSFKGGNVQIFLSLMHNMDFHTYFLTTNYRSCRKIIEMANRVIHQVDDYVEKPTNCAQTMKGRVEIASKHKLSEMLAKITDFKNVFLLVRTNKDLVAIANMLEDLQIPYSSFRKGELTLTELKEELQNDTIKLLTIHSAKGLEADSVILWGNFPIYQPSYLKNDDERKVLYVGMTRAKKNLTILN